MHKSLAVALVLALVLLTFNCVVAKSHNGKARIREKKELVEVESDSMLGAGATLQVTEALRVRNGPCTDKGVITMLQAGAKVTYTGSATNSCGYTWYQVKGSFGTGYAASNWLKEVSNAGAVYTVTEALRVRNGPCTDKGVITMLQAGAKVTLTGESHTGCGYTWYGVKGSFGSGYAASNWLKEGGGGGPGQCNTRTYPLFKQCGQSWSGDSMGGTRIAMCREGCLVSSVSMALNGLGKSINGQKANPGTLNSWLSRNGGYSGGNGFRWGSVGPLGLNHQYYTHNKDDMRSQICAGRVVILAVKNGGHYVLATGVGNGGFHVNDPGYAINYYQDSQVAYAHVYTH